MRSKHKKDTGAQQRLSKVPLVSDDSDFEDHPKEMKRAKKVKVGRSRAGVKRMQVRLGIAKEDQCKDSEHKETTVDECA